MGFIDETALGSLDLLSRTWKKHLHTVKKLFIPSKDGTREKAVDETVDTEPGSITL